MQVGNATEQSTIEIVIITISKALLALVCVATIAGFGLLAPETAARAVLGVAIEAALRE